MQDAAARKLREDEYTEVPPARPNLRLVDGEPSARRTVVITGQPEPPRRRRPSASAQQIQARPDRIALWAFLLGLFLVAVAAGTAHT
jgi:hypothetical protein